MGFGIDKRTVEWPAEAQQTRVNGGLPPGRGGICGNGKGFTAFMKESERL